MLPIRKRLLYRLQLELLEDRLPPGDALLGILMGISALPGDAADSDFATDAPAKHSILSSNLEDECQGPLGATKPAPATVRLQPTGTATDYTAKVKALET